MTQQPENALPTEAHRPPYCGYYQRPLPAHLRIPGRFVFVANATGRSDAVILRDDDTHIIVQENVPITRFSPIERKRDVSEQVLTDYFGSLYTNPQPAALS